MVVSKDLKIFTDGGSRGNPGQAAIGIYVETANGDSIFTQSQSIGVATNNEAEYTAFLTSLNWLATHQTALLVESVEWFLDSKLVVEQVNKNWKIKEVRLQKMAQQCWVILDKLTCQYQITYVPREKNHHADALVNEALDALISR